MLRLELDEREHEVLTEALRSYLADLRTEVGHTDRLAYRKRLKAQEHLLKSILDKVEHSEMAA